MADSFRMWKGGFTRSCDGQLRHRLVEDDRLGHRWEMTYHSECLHLKTGSAIVDRNSMSVGTHGIWLGSRERHRDWLLRLFGLSG